MHARLPFQTQTKLRLRNLGVLVKNALRALVLSASCLVVHDLYADPLPRIALTNGAGQLIVSGQPFLVLGGELGNSSASTAEQADLIIPKLAAMHVNTILMPVPWEQIEPKEGDFEFHILDHWIAVAGSMICTSYCFGLAVGKMPSPTMLRPG